MRKLISTAMIVAVLATALVNLSSCEKDKGTLPNISFKTGTVGSVTYTSTDQHVNVGDILNVGINCSKSEGEDVVKTLNESLSINGGAATTVKNTTIPTANEDSYNEDYLITAAGASGNTLKYTWTVSNRDGLLNSVSLTLTVN